MVISRFEDIIAWQKSKELAILIYQNFEKSKDFGFRDQILRSSVSIMNNIAEGFERKTNNELKYFLFVAKGSCGELRSMVILAKELKMVQDSVYSDLYNRAEEVSKLISGFIKKL